MADETNVNQALKGVDDAVQSAATPSTPQPAPEAPKTSEQTKAEVQSMVDTAKQVASVGEYHLPTKEEIQQAIHESDNLVTALEAVGAMYRIPASNIISNSDKKCISVECDKIIAPPLKNPSANTKAIVCSIGAVLDHISQRVNDKLNDLQYRNIEEGRLKHPDGNPSKGTIVLTTTDANGDIIIVYDTGLIDAEHTPEAHEKIKELRQNMQIPMYGVNQMKRPTYFSDEDDLMKGVVTEKDMEIEEYSIEKELGEDAIYLPIMELFQGTRMLGYNIMWECGFDYVKASGDLVYQETATEKQKKSKKSKLSPKDLKHMKFNNKGIVEAVKYFNKAKNEQKDVSLGNLDIDQFINSENYKKAIDALDAQFDAKINLRFIDNDRSSNVFTTPIIFNDEYKQKIRVSKKDGFKLNGLPIDIWVIKHSIEKLATDQFFGQTMCSVFLHEIFHNIYYVMMRDQINQSASLEVAMATAASMPDVKSRRIVFTKYVNTLDDFFGLKMNMLNKRILIKRLCVISMTETKEELEYLQNTNNQADIDMDGFIKIYKKRVKAEKRLRRLNPLNAVIPVALETIAHFVLKTAFTGASIGFAIGFLSIDLLNYGIIHSIDKSFKNTENREEHYCDMFAAMYRVPVRWFNIPFFKNKNTPKDVDNDKLKEFNSLEKQLRQYQYIPYPTSLERSKAGLQAAKKMLEHKETLDPSIRKYLEWIVDNYSDLLDDKLEIGNTADNVYDPESAKNLDKHLQILLKGKDVEITEYASLFTDEMIPVFTESDYLVEKQESIYQEAQSSKAKHRYEKFYQTIKDQYGYEDDFRFARAPKSVLKKKGLIPIDPSIVKQIKKINRIRDGEIDDEGMDYISFIVDDTTHRYRDTYGVYHVPKSEENKFLEGLKDVKDLKNRSGSFTYEKENMNERAYRKSKLIEAPSDLTNNTNASARGIKMHKRDMQKLPPRESNAIFNHEMGHKQNAVMNDFEADEEKLAAKYVQTHYPSDEISSHDKDPNEIAADIYAMRHTIGNDKDAMGDGLKRIYNENKRKFESEAKRLIHKYIDPIYKHADQYKEQLAQTNFDDPDSVAKLYNFVGKCYDETAAAATAIRNQLFRTRNANAYWHKQAKFIFAISYEEIQMLKAVHKDQTEENFKSIPEKYNEILKKCEDAKEKEFKYNEHIADGLNYRLQALQFAKEKDK